MVDREHRRVLKKCDIDRDKVLMCIKQGKKIGNFGRFFGDFSVFGGSGKKNPWKKSTEKISASRFFAEKSENSDIFPKKSNFSKKIGFFLKFGINYLLGH